MKGKLNAIKYNGVIVILSCKQTFIIKSDDKSINKEAIIPQVKLKRIHCFIALSAPFLLSFAISSDTILVEARFIPEVASVIANVYTDIIRPNRPILSAPTLFDTYTLKEMPIVCIKIAVAVSMTTLIKNSFAFLKKSPSFLLYKYMRLIKFLEKRLQKMSQSDKIN